MASLLLALALSSIVSTSHRFVDVVNVKDYGAVPDDGRDDTSAIDAAVAALPARGSLPGATLIFPPGTYTKTTALALATNGATIVGYGATLQSSDATAAIDLGQASYLTDLTGGYYQVKISGLRIEPAAGATGIRNRGIRSVTLEDVDVSGGAASLDSEGAWRKLHSYGSLYRNASGIGVHLRQRNNNALFVGGAILAAGSYGLLVDSTSFGASPGAENKGHKFLGVDFEGNHGAVYVVGNVGSQSYEGCWWENNLDWNFKLDNEPGLATSFNKYGIAIRGGQITGAGSDVLIGTNAAGTLIQGVTVEGVEFVDSDLVFTGGPNVLRDSWEWNNSHNGTSTRTLPAQGLPAEGSSLAVHRPLPLYENPDASLAPWGTADTKGPQGLIVYDDSYIYLKTSAGWKRAALTTF